VGKTAARPARGSPHVAGRSAILAVRSTVNRSLVCIAVGRALRARDMRAIVNKWTNRDSAPRSRAGRTTRRATLSADIARAPTPRFSLLIDRASATECAGGIVAAAKEERAISRIDPSIDGNPRVGGRAVSEITRDRLPSAVRVDVDVYR